MWKFLTGIAADEIYNHLEENNLLKKSSEIEKIMKRRYYFISF